MKAHEFYNMLEGRIILYKIGDNPLHKYPYEFIQRYNFQVEILEKLAEEVKEAMQYMAEIELEQFKYVAGGRANEQ